MGCIVGQKCALHLKPGAERQSGAAGVVPLPWRRRATRVSACKHMDTTRAMRMPRLDPPIRGYPGSQPGVLLSSSGPARFLQAVSHCHY